MTRVASPSTSASGGKVRLGVIANYATVFVQIGVAFFLTPFLVKTLGEEKYGLWSVIAASAGYMALIDLGVASAVTKFVAEFRNNEKVTTLQPLLNAAARRLTIASLVLLSLTPFAAWAISAFVKTAPELKDQLFWSVILAGLEISVFVGSGLYRGVLAGNHRFDLIGSLTIFTTVLRAIAMAFVVHAGGGLIEMSVVALCVTSLAALVSFKLSRKVAPEVRARSIVKVPTEAKQRVGVFARATFISMVAAQLVFYTDALVVGAFVSAVAVAHYTIAWSLCEYVNRLMISVGKALVPLFSERDTQGDDMAMYRLYKVAVRFQLGVSMLFCIGLAVLGTAFISAWIDADFASQSAPILMLLLIAQVVRGPQLIGYSLLQGKGLHTLYSYWNLGFSILNLLLSIALVQVLGMWGVALATAITQTIFFGLVAPLLVLNRLNVSVLTFISDTWIRAIPAALVLAASLHYLLKLFPSKDIKGVFILGILGACCYLPVAFFTLLERSQRTRLISRNKV